MGVVICESSMEMTLVCVSDQMACDQGLGATAGNEVIGWILDRQIKSGSYRGLFEPLRLDNPKAARTITGERLHTRLGIRNTLSQEAANMLWILGSDRIDVREAIQLTSARMSKACYALHHCVIGECAHSSIGYLRFQTAVHAWGNPQWIHRHLSVIRSLRDGSGRWSGLPFYYTLLCLLELENERADDELRYATPACIRVAHRKQPNEGYGRRRTRLIEAVLETYSGSPPSSLQLFDERDCSNR